jgi:hypothetical protein
MAGGDTKLATLLGLKKPSAIANYRTRGRIPRGPLLLLRWYVATGHVEPPAEIAALSVFREFASVVGGHKQLRKVVLALAETEHERKMFDDAMTAAEQ